MNDYCLAGSRNERWIFAEPYMVEGDFDSSTWWRVVAVRQDDGMFTCGTGATRQEAIDACKRNIDNYGAIDGLTVPFVDYVRAQQQWSEHTFGPGRRTMGILDHIKKEMLEIINDPADVGEWIDIIILGIDGAWRTGATPKQVAEALAAKQARNFARVWPDWRTMSEDQAIEHDRSAELATVEPLPTPNTSPPIWDLVIADMQARDRAGRKRYGTPLQANNGRKALVDAYQEVLDLAVYLRQEIEERQGRGVDDAPKPYICRECRAQQSDPNTRCLKCGNPTSVVLNPTYCTFYCAEDHANFTET